MKRLLLLGGLRYLIPLIRKAKKMGIYVITCDYLPENIAHKYADEYHNISILDKEAVLNLARKLKVDGIMSFAVDPGVLTASFVCEELGLPAPGPHQSVKILQNKALFREFLQKNGFNVPKAKGYSEIDIAVNDASGYKWPIIVKPVDSAGSKGVSKIYEKNELPNKILNALSYSSSKQFIIEEFIEQKGFASDSDCFSLDGNLVCYTLSNQRFDSKAPNPYTPSGFSWPSLMPVSKQVELKSEIQRLLKLLKMGTSLYNIETRIGNDDEAYIMEVSPRGGGNRLSEMVEYATGVDLISYAIKSAIGDTINVFDDPVYQGYWGEIILHSNKEGIFENLEVESSIKDCIYQIDLWITKGTYVKPFAGANDTLGTIVIKCENQDQLEDIITNHHNYIRLVIK